MTNRAALIAALVGLTVSGCGAVTAGTAVPAAQSLPASADTLPDLLLPAADVSAVLGSPGVVITQDSAAPWDGSAGLSDRTPGCLAVAGAAQRGAYAGTGFTAVHSQVLREPPTSPAWSNFATQAVVLFDSPQKAADFFARSREGWAACSDRTLSYRQPMASAQVWSVGPVTVDRGVLAVSRSERSPELWSCQRALTVHGKAVVDVEACSRGEPQRGTGPAASIARQIADRIGPA